MATKFSDFIEGGNVRVGDKTVGLRNGDNYQFTMPGTGIEDENGNLLVGWSKADNAVNYAHYKNADTGDAPSLEMMGDDALINFDINTKGNGDVNLNMGTGRLVINSTTGVDEVTNDTTLASSSPTSIPTENAVKTYVDNSALPTPIPIANGGTNNTTLGASGTLAQSDGTKINYTTATYPSAAGASGNVLVSDGINFNSTDIGKSYGAIVMNPGVFSPANGFNHSGIYAEVAGLPTPFVLNSNTADFTMTTDGRLLYTGVDTKTFFCGAVVAMDGLFDSAISIYKNGNAIAGSEQFIYVNGSNSISNVEVTLSTNDHLSVYLKATIVGTTDVYFAKVYAESILV